MQAMKEKPARTISSTAPMKIEAAGEIWSRKHIKQFAFPQPPAPRRQPALRLRQPGYLVDVTTPHLPVAGDVTAIPAGERKNLALANMNLTAASSRTRRPDKRRVFNDTTYPWRCCGRVVTAAGQCTGALIGPRHLLTVSHVVDWIEINGSIGWLRFEPGYFEGDVFPAVHAVEIYSYECITDTNVDDHDVASDYVVCVLDSDIGNKLGWFGSKTYDPDWDDYTYWSHVGYPEDLAAGAKPFFEGEVTVKNSWRPGFLENGYGRNILIDATTSSGNSGGPFFGWWDDGPYIVGVVCAAGKLTPVITHPVARKGNWVGGGDPLPSLIHQARTEFP
jgi:V8-like Glu-specific endopeptidase